MCKFHTHKKTKDMRSRERNLCFLRIRKLLIMSQGLLYGKKLFFKGGNLQAYYTQKSVGKILI